MGYQALLFCPDEKLARVIGQVFTELDFTVDPVHEPFAAVKQLMAHRYDAVVVDCENEQNASLLFRSARNSSFNQSSLALALVEGQTGVAKAYRIGANLVLTKPINVEQAKGTLRIARGLLRKGADAATAAASTNASAMAARAGAGSAGNSGTVVSANAGLASAPPQRAGMSDFAPPSLAADSAPTPAAVEHSSSTAASQVSVAARLDTDLNQNSLLQRSFDQTSNENAARVPSIAAQSGSIIDSATSSSHNAIKNVVKTEPSISATTSASAKPSAATATSTTGSAAASAPAREPTATAVRENKVPATKSTGSSRSTPAQATASAVPTLAANTSSLNAPTFGGLSQEGGGGSGRNKKILIAAVVILALAALSYFSGGKPKFGTNRTPDPANAPQDSSQPAPTLKPMSSTAAEPATGTTGVASSANHASPYPTATTDKPPAGLGDPEEIRLGGKPSSNTIPIHNSDNASNISSIPDPATKAAGVAPIQVKARAAKVNSQTQADESAPSPATLALTSANDSNISNLMSPASFNLSKPALATVKVSQGVSQGLLIKRVQPHYPQSAIALHSQGAVQIEATINKEGSVINPKVIKGDPLLARAALDAVKQWRYKPYYLDGSPVEIQTEITINFKAN